MEYKSVQEKCGLKVSTLHETETTTREALPPATSDDLRDALRTLSTVIDTLLATGLEECIAVVAKRRKVVTICRVGIDALMYVLQEALDLLLRFLMQSITETDAEKYDVVEP